MALGDVVAVGEDAADRALAVGIGWKTKSSSRSSRGRRGGAGADRHRPAGERLAAAIDLVEQLEEALALDLRHRLADRLADQVAPPTSFW
jgi:hypothetical protein